MLPLVIAMIFAAAMIAFVLLVWAACDSGEKPGQAQSRGPDEPGEREPAQIAA
jgi:hypothetical protein